MLRVFKKSIGIIISFIMCLSAGLSIFSLINQKSKKVEGAGTITTAVAQSFDKRKVIDFNTGWLFSKGEGYNNSLSTSEAVEHVVVIENGSLDENSKQVYDVGYNTTGWKNVSLPHTYNDVDTFDTFTESLNGSQEKGASVSQNGERTLYSGTAWYKKLFFIPSDWSSKELIVEFEGARQAASVWINGQRLEGDSLNGFVAFGYDITSKIIPGQTNEITVLVDNSYPYCVTVNDNDTPLDSSDDYMQTMFDADYSIYSNTGTYGVDETTTINANNIVNPLVWHDSHWQPNYGGLYRNSNLYVTDKLQLTLPLYSFMQTQGTYVYTTREDGTQKTARVNIEAEVKNNSEETRAFAILYQIYNASGELVGTKVGSQSLTGGQTQIFKASIDITNVIRWSDEYPYQYTCYCSLWTGTTEAATLIDHNETKFGIRTYRFTTNGGFYLNENYTYLTGYGQKSTNEWAGIGAAYSDWMQDYVIAQMKRGGSNYLRYGHTSAGKSQISACDNYGILVTQPGVDGEGSYSSSTPVPQREKMVYTAASLDVRANAFRDMIIQFRNNPSIIAWEIGNKDIDMVWDAESGDYVEDSTWADRMLGYVNTYDKGNRNASGGVDNVGTKAETTSTSHRVVLQRGDASSTYYDIFESTLGSASFNNPVIEGEYNRLEARRGVGDLYIDGFENFSNAYVSGQGEYEFSTSESFAVEQIHSYYEYLKSKGSAMMGGANWIYSDSISHGRLLSEVSRASGEVDATFLEKESYYVNKVIFGNDIDSYIIGNWNYPVGTTKTVYVAAKNASSVTLCVDWYDDGNLQTDVYNSAVIDYDGMLYTFNNVVYRPGTIRTVVRNNSSVVIDNASSSKFTTGQATKLAITKVNTLPLLANGGDYLLLDVELLDENNNRVTTDKYINYNNDGTFSLLNNKQVHFSLSGDVGTGEWLGGYNSFLENTIRSNALYIEAGIIRVAIRTTNIAGNITLNANMDGMTPASITVRSNSVADLNTSGDAYNLVAKQPNRLTYSLQSLYEPNYGSILGEGDSLSTTVASSFVSFTEITSGGTDYSYAVLSKHSQVYMDKETTFTSVPEKYLTAEFLQTLSANYTVGQDVSYLNFTLNKPCNLLILINNQIEALPSWMTSDYTFTKTGSIAIDSNGVIYDIYSSELLEQDRAYYIGGIVDDNFKTMFIPAFYSSDATGGILYEETFSDETQQLTKAEGSNTTISIEQVADSQDITKDALKFVDKSATYNSHENVDYALFEKEFASQTGKFIFEFDFWMATSTALADANLPNRFIRIVFQEGAAGGSFDGSGAKAGVRMFIDNATSTEDALEQGRLAIRNKLSSVTDDDIYLNKDGVAQANPQQFIPLDTWITFKLEIDTVAKQYKIYAIINDVELQLYNGTSDVITYTQDITKLDHMIIASGGSAAGTFAVTNLRIIKVYDNLVESVKVNDVELSNFHEDTQYYYVTKPDGSLYNETEIQNAVVKMKLSGSEEQIISPIIDKKRGLITIVAQRDGVTKTYYLLFNKTAYYSRLNGDYLQELYSIQAPGKTSITKLRTGTLAYSNTATPVTVLEYSNCYMGADWLIGGHSFGNNAIGINNLNFVAPSGTLIVMFLPFDHNVSYPWTVSEGFVRTNNFAVLSNGEKYIAFEKTLEVEGGGNQEIHFTFDETTFNGKFPIVAAISLTDLGEFRKEGGGISFDQSNVGEFPSAIGSMEYVGTTHTSETVFAAVEDSVKSEGIFEEGQKGLHLHDSITGDGVYTYFQLGNVTTNCTISADFYIKNVTTLTENSYIRFFLQSGANSGKVNNNTEKTGIDRTLTHIYFSKGTVSLYTYSGADNIYNGKTASIGNNAIPIGEWFTAVYEIDFSTKTFVLKIVKNGEVTWTSDLDKTTPEIDGRPFSCEAENSNNINLIQFATGGSGKQDVYIKNIQRGHARTNAITNLKYNDVEVSRFDESGEVYTISLNSNNEFDVDDFSAVAGTGFNEVNATGLSGSLDESGSFVNLTYNYDTSNNLNFKVYLIGNSGKLISKINEINYPSLHYSNYTTESWDSFILKYIAAQNVLATDSTNYLSLETAYSELNTAFQNLEPIVSITVNNAENGSFSCNKELSLIAAGDEVVITFNPSTGYTLSNVNIDGVSSYDLTGNVLTFTMPNSVVVITPEFSLKSYIITWKNYDGTELERDVDVAYNSMPSFDGETPTRPSTLEFNYTFAGWSPEISAAAGDAVYTATFTPIYIEYTLSFPAQVSVVKETQLSTESTVHYNDEITITFASTEGYDMTSFNVSGATLVSENTYRVTGNVIVTYAETIKTFAITLPEIQTGYSISTESTNPVEYNGAYSFSIVLSNEYSESTVVVKVNSVIITPTENVYTISNIKEQKTITVEGLEINTYSVTFKVDGETYGEVQTVNYGEDAIAPENPTKPSTAQFDFEFSNWDKAFTNIRANVEINAVFTSVLRKYTITWNNYDGTELEKDVNVEYDSTPSFDGATPTRPSTLAANYTFAGWSPEVSNVSGDVVYTATFTEQPIIYVLTYDANLTGVENPANNNAAYGVFVALPTVSKEGFIFIGWQNSEDEDNDTYRAGSQLRITKNLNLVGKWKVVLKTEEPTPEILIEANNIDAGGVLENNATLNVEKIEEEDDSFTDIAQTVGDNVDFVAYDITIFNGDTEISGQLESAITLKIKIPEGFDANKIKVYRVDGATKTQCTISSVENGYALIEADHFSVYVVSQEIETTNNAQTSSTSKQDPNKGSSPIGLIAGIGGGVLVIGIVVAIIIIKKKKK